MELKFNFKDATSKTITIADTYKMQIREEIEDARIVANANIENPTADGSLHTIWDEINDYAVENISNIVCTIKTVAYTLNNIDSINYNLSLDGSDIRESINISYVLD